MEILGLVDFQIIAYSHPNMIWICSQLSLYRLAFHYSVDKMNAPVGTLLDIYDNSILKIDSLLSLTSLFDLEYNIEVFVRQLLDM